MSNDASTFRRLRPTPNTQNYYATGLARTQLYQDDARIRPSSPKQNRHHISRSGLVAPVGVGRRILKRPRPVGDAASLGGQLRRGALLPHRLLAPRRLELRRRLLHLPLGPVGAAGFLRAPFEQRRALNTQAMSLRFASVDWSVRPK